MSRSRPVDEAFDEVLQKEPAPFRDAVRAVVTADADALSDLLDEFPALVSARAVAPHHSTLLHYVAANGIENPLQLSPLSVYQRLQVGDRDCQSGTREQIMKTVSLLLQRGAEVDALADTYGGGPAQTPLNLLVSSDHPARAGVLADLVEAFCTAGAKVDGVVNDSSPILIALAFGHPPVVAALVRHGARTDNLLLVAAAGDVEQLATFYSHGGFRTGDLERCFPHAFPLPEDPRVAAELALVLACLCGHVEVVRALLQRGVDIDATPPGSHRMWGPLQTARAMGQVAVEQLLIEWGADPN